MATTLFDSAAENRPSKSRQQNSGVYSGTVINPCDGLAQGKVLVRIPAVDQEVWARIAAPGAGGNTGLFHNPNIGDEVLVALIHGDPAEAYIIGGLWSTSASPPVSGVQEVLTKRKLRTGVTPVAGVAPVVGHEVEFDDGVGQSITVTTSTKQKIVLEPTKIEISTTGGTVKLVLDLATQTLKIDAPMIEIGGDTTVSLTLKAANIDIGSGTTLKTTIKGAMVMIN